MTWGSCQSVTLRMSGECFQTNKLFSTQIYLAATLIKQPQIQIHVYSSSSCYYSLASSHRHFGMYNPSAPHQAQHLPSWVMLQLNPGCRTQSGEDLECVLQRA